jgi:hypothetical protein
MGGVIRYNICVVDSAGLAGRFRGAGDNNDRFTAEMAKRMHTSRAYLDRFLNPENSKVPLETLQRAAAAAGRKLRLELA